VIIKIIVLLLGLFVGCFIRAWKSASRGTQQMGPFYLGEAIAAASIGFSFATGGLPIGIALALSVAGVLFLTHRLACTVWCKRHPEAKLLNPRRLAVLAPHLSFEKWQSEKEKAQAMAKQMVASGDRTGTRKLREFGDLTVEVTKMLHAVTNVCGPRAAQLIFHDSEVMSFYVSHLQLYSGDHSAAANQLAASLGLSEKRAA
jgi:hypothetical protein